MFKLRLGIIRGLIIFSMLATTSGCATPVLLAVGAGALGGYSISRDTFEGMTAKGQEEIFTAAQEVASIMGSVESADKRRGEIYARIQATNITITIVPINMTTTKLRVKARKGIFPRIGVAQEVYTKIINQLEKS